MLSRLSFFRISLTKKVDTCWDTIIPLLVLFYRKSRLSWSFTWRANLNKSIKFTYFYTNSGVLVYRLSQDSSERYSLQIIKSDSFIKILQNVFGADGKLKRWIPNKKHFSCNKRSKWAKLSIFLTNSRNYLASFNRTRKWNAVRCGIHW